MLRKNSTKAKLKAGQVAIGFRMDFVSPYIVEVMGNVGFDFVYFDCEHGPMGEEGCEEMIRAAELVGLTPLVRVPSNEPGVILRYLDLGAMGVIIPHCHTKQTAEAAVKAVKYPPVGERGIAGRSLALSAMPVPDYIREANKETIVIAMIEDEEGINNFSEILTVDGLDVFFIGRLDLSVSLGIPGQVDHPKIKENVEKIITSARAANKAVGIGAIDVGKPESIKQFSSQGAQFFSLNVASILTSASRDLLKKIKGS